MNSVKVIKKLGSGVMGTTYLIELSQGKEKRRYICKIEKIWESDSMFRLDAPIWREIIFAKFCKKYPEHFMILKSWEIMNDCNHKQMSPGWKMDTYSRKNWTLRNKSPYCSKLVYQPVLDGTLNTVLASPKLKLPQLASILSQIIYSIDLLIKSGFIHRDLHGNNIMYKKTTKKSIMLGKVECKTYGLQWFLIDYGLIIHPTFICKYMHKQQRREELNLLNNKHYDLARFIFLTINMPIWNMIEKNNLFDKLPNETKLVKMILKTPEFITIKKYLPPIKEEPITLNNCIFILFLLNYPHKYHEMLGFGDSKYNKLILNYDSIKDMYCNIIKRIHNPGSIIKYLKTLT